MKKNYFKVILAAPILFAAVIMSCSHDKSLPDTTSPAYFITQSETLAIPASVDLPANLPNGNSRVATFYAVGVQKYKAQLIAGSNPAAYEWVFVAPQANLYDIKNSKVGTHSAGPDWQLSAADSMFGQSFTPPRTATAANPNSIDWLLLMPKIGKIPTGIFANVSYVQRIATNGGKAPTAPPATETDTYDSPYTAVYRFTKQN